MNNEEIKEFRNQLKRDYSFVVYKIEDITKEIEDLYYQMSGFKAIDYSKEPSNTNQQAIELYKLTLGEKISECELVLINYKNKLKQMDDILNRLEDCDKEMFLMKYLKHKTYYEIGKIYYLSASAVTKRMNKALEKI